jgi:cytochrome P450
MAARAPAIASNPARFLERAARRYGDVVRLGPGPHLLNRPELAELLLEDPAGFEKGQVPRRLLGDGLLASEGDAHARNRAAIEPLFSAAAVERRVQGSGEVIDRWTAAWPPGGVLDIQEEMAALNRETAMRVLFGLDPESAQGRSLAAELETATGADARLSLLPVPGLARLPLASNRRFRRALAGVDASVGELIRERRRMAQGGDDLLSALLDADAPGADEGLGDRQVRDEIVNLFSGRKSVAQALAWTWHLLALHPEVQERLRREAGMELEDGRLSVGSVAGLSYARAVLAESMRLFPPIWVLARRARHEHEIDDHGIPEGATVLVSPYVLQRDPRYWAAPDSFHPDRWHPKPAARPRYAYFPFGGGERSCVGEPLAWTEGVLTLAAVARRWSVEPAPGHRVHPVARVSLRARSGIRLVVRPR